MTLSLILTLRPGLPRARLPLVILGLIGDRFPDGINQVWEWPLRASLLSLTVLGVPQGTKGELGAAFWHELPKMSGFVHVDSPRGQSNGPRLATTT